MKRFFCSVCNKTKRVRILPRRISPNTFSIRGTINNFTKVEDRIGICDRHMSVLDKVK